MKIIKGGVCAPQGFTASGVHCGIRKNKTKKDLALIYSQIKGTAACVYTQNLVKGAPIYVTKNHVADGYAQAVICNSGNANTCNSNGIEVANEVCTELGKKLKINTNDIIIASTGVIGQPLNSTPIIEGMDSLINELGDKSEDANLAIMTTDLTQKTIAMEFEIDGKKCRMGGIAKGSGMIHPNMATMLVFITTDVAISASMLQKALSEDVENTFNMVSVDGDTSTNDMVSIIANGLAGNKEIVSEGKDFNIFKEALYLVTSTVCKKIAADGEGATKLIECRVKGAKSINDARVVAKSIITSSLVKAAMFGADANWGRILCAIGYSNANVDVLKVDVVMSSTKGVLPVCKNGMGVSFSEEQAKEILLEKEIYIDIDLKDGQSSSIAWGCDLTYDYVKINGDYRT